MDEIIKYQEKDKLDMPNILNRSVHKFDSVLCKRIFYVVMSQIEKEYRKCVENKIDFSADNLYYEIPSKLIDPAQRFKEIQKAAQELTQIRFDFLDPENSRFSLIVPFPVVLYEKRWGSLKVNVHPAALPFLAKMDKGYYSIKLRSVLSLSSKYSQRWYDLLSEKEFIGKMKLTLSDIRTIMDVKENDYSTTSNFLQRVIYAPIREINEKTELSIPFSPINNQKCPILGFDFTITQQDVANKIKAYTKEKSYFDELKNLSPAEKSNKLNEIMREYSLQSDLFQTYDLFSPDVLNAILEADSGIKSGKLKVAKTKTRYMAGVIKNASKLSLKNGGE